MGEAGFLKNTMEERIKPVDEKSEKIKIRPYVKTTLLYKGAGEVKMQKLSEKDERWLAFCEKVYEKESKEAQVAKELIARMDWMEEVQFIWYEGKQKNLEKTLKKAKTIILVQYIDNRKIFITDGKQGKKVTIHILP